MQNQTFKKDSVFLVTGGAGFIGSNLCDALIDLGYFVRCLDDFSTGKRDNIKQLLKNPLFELIEGDIRDIDTCLKACKDVDYVSHQAAWGSVPKSIAFPLVYEAINIKGTLNMLEAARQQKVKSFVYASSSSVYGDEATLPKVEKQVGNLLSPYALTKKTCEDYAKLYSRLYGLPTIGLRYFNVFGRRQDPKGAYAAVIPRVVTALLRNESPIIHGDGSQSRDFTYIDNVIQANLKGMLAAEKQKGEVFNIACGGQESILAVYQKIAKRLKKETSPIFEDKRPGDIKHSHADIVKAKDLLGYEPNYGFDAGIRLAIDWYEENL